MDREICKEARGFGASQLHDSRREARVHEQTLLPRHGMGSHDGMYHGRIIAAGLGESLAGFG